MVKSLLSAIFGELWQVIFGLFTLTTRTTRENFNLSILALALSAFLWVFITGEQNPPRTDYFTENISVHPVNVPQELAVSGNLEPVLVRITAPSDMWTGLTTNSFDATVDLSGLAAGEATRQVRVEPRDSRIRVLEVAPNTVAVELDALARRMVPVRVNLLQAPPLGFSNQLPEVTPAEVEVTGPQRLVDLVENVVAQANLGNARTNFRQTLPLIAQASQGYDVEGIRIEPQQATVEIAITRHVNFVTLPLVVDLQGTPAAGYWTSQVRHNPATVTVQGPEDVLQSLSYLTTQPVDVSNASVTFSRRIGFALPEGVTASDSTDVMVDVSIQPLSSSAVFRVAPQITGVGSNLKAHSEIPWVTVTVSAEGAALQTTTVDFMRIMLNVGDKGAGTYQITPQVSIPIGIRLLRLNPETIPVTIETIETSE